MQALGVISKSRQLVRVLRGPAPIIFNSAECVRDYQIKELALESTCEYSYSIPLRRHFHLFSGNDYTSSSPFESEIQKVRIQSLTTMMPTRLFSSEAATNESADTVKDIYDKILHSVADKRTAPPNAWLWSLVAKCSTREDIELLFNILQKLRVFRLSNLRIPDDFNSALCREVTRACIRAGAIFFGLKSLWKHNLYGLTPDIGSAHQLLLHAKEHNDVGLMVKVMKLVKTNDLPLQPGTADLVFCICFSVGRWDLMTKYGKRFVTSGVKLRQTSFELWMEFAAKKGDVESLWKVEKWRSDIMNKHSLSTGFSCSKGFLLEHKPQDAAAMIQLLFQALPEAKMPSMMNQLQTLVSEWPLEVIKQQKENKKAFALALQNDISVLVDALPSPIKGNVTIQDLSEKEAVLS